MSLQEDLDHASPSKNPIRGLRANDAVVDGPSTCEAALRADMDRRASLLKGLSVLAAASIGVVAVLGDETSQVPTTKPKMVRSDEGNKVWAMGVQVTIKVRAEDTGGAYSVFEDVVPPGAGPPPHIHTREDEAMYVVEGELSATLGGEKFNVKAGSWVHMPRGVEHSFRNNSSKPARMIMTYTPGGFEKWFQDIGTPISDLNSSAPTISPDDVKKAIATAESYGVKFRH